MHYHGSKASWKSCEIYGLLVCSTYSIFQQGCKGCNRKKVTQNDITSNYTSTTHAPKNAVPNRNVHISQTTLPQVSFTQWQMVMAIPTGIFFLKRPWNTRNSPLYSPHIRRQMRYLKIISQFTNFNVVNNGSEGDIGEILTALSCKMWGFYICFTRRSPNLITIYHVRIYEWVIEIFQTFTTKFFFSLDYNPDTTRDLSTHKWYIIFPTQFIVNNHTQKFGFINFSNGFPINL